MINNATFSTGGIVALSFAVNHMPIEACIESFINTCDKAFSPRLLGNKHGTRKAVTLTRGSRYRSTPLYESLKDSLGKRSLYGGHQRTSSVYSTKVAVTSTSGTGREPILLTNYCRSQDDSVSHSLEFSRDSRRGMLVWQAAAATSAAPGYFRPFEDIQSHKKYMDGGLYYNNPARLANLESKLIWPETAKSHPDIFLSLGTGQNSADTKKHVGKGKKSMSIADSRKQAMRIGDPSRPKKKQPHLMHKIASHFVKTAVSSL